MSDAAAAKALREARKAKILATAGNRMKIASAGMDEAAPPPPATKTLDVVPPASCSSSSSSSNSSSSVEKVIEEVEEKKQERVEGTEKEAVVDEPGKETAREEVKEEEKEKKGESVVKEEKEKVEEEEEEKPPAPLPPIKTPLKPSTMPASASKLPVLPSSPTPVHATGLRSSVAAQSTPLPSSPTPFLPASPPPTMASRPTPLPGAAAKRPITLHLPPLLPTLHALAPLLLAFTLVFLSRACSLPDWVELSGGSTPTTPSAMDDLQQQQSVDDAGVEFEGGGGGVSAVPRTSQLAKSGGLLLPLIQAALPVPALCSAASPAQFLLSAKGGLWWILPVLVLVRFFGDITGVVGGYFKPKGIKATEVELIEGSKFNLGRLVGGVTSALTTYRVYTDFNADVSLFVVGMVLALVIV